MESFSVPVEKIEKETRREKMEVAERSVFQKFDERLAKVLEEMGKNPYFETERSF